MANQTSVHFQPVKAGSEEHNKRLKFLDYVHYEFTAFNDYWESDTQSARLAAIKANYTAHVGRKLHAKATPIREAVVVIKQDTTMEDLKNLADAYKKNWGIEVFQIAIHRDEGYKSKSWPSNIHAHLVADWTDHESGKTLKLDREDMAMMQTITADVLHMERGISSEKKHLNARQYKVKKEEEKLAALEKRVNSLQEEETTLQKKVDSLQTTLHQPRAVLQNENNRLLKSRRLLINSIRHLSPSLYDAINAIISRFKATLTHFLPEQAKSISQAMNTSTNRREMGKWLLEFSAAYVGEELPYEQEVKDIADDKTLEKWESKHVRREVEEELDDDLENSLDTPHITYFHM